MLNIPALRWGQPYASLETDDLAHFATGEPIARISRTNAGLVQRDLRKAQQARAALRAVPIDELIARVAKAGELYLHGTLAMGDCTQTPDEFVKAQSATTGLPERLARANMQKNGFVLTEMRRILSALTRELDLNVLTAGHGMERGVPISYQAQSPVLGAVLPSNSPGVHTLWLPVVPLQLGLMLKPGSQEPWTPYRIAEAFFAAGIPREAIGIYPGGHDVGGAILAGCGRSLMFGGQAAVDQHRGNPRIQVHGPGFSKILIGDDVVDNWPAFLDVLVESVVANGGRSCINASGIWASRHTREIATALAERLAAIRPLPPDHPEALLAAFTVPGAAAAIARSIDGDAAQPGVTDMSAAHRDGSRHVTLGRADYLLPSVLHCDSPEPVAAQREYMFPFVSVVRCDQAKMPEAIGPTLVCTVLSNDSAFQRQLLDSVNVDRLNFGPVATTALNWLQPHEGNLVEFLYRPRAFQQAGVAV